jgi:dihydrolipoamide dehydrogenase
MLRAFGTELTVVELVPKVMPLIDQDVSASYSKILSRKGINFVVGNSVKNIEYFDDHMKVTLTNDQQLDVDQIIVGVGRASNVEVIHTDKVVLERGKIKVDKTLQTSEEGTYAIGDVAFPPVPRGALAHVASHEGIFAVKHILGESKEMDWHAVPWVVFTDPPLAAVGMMEKEANQANIAVKTYNLSYKALGAALAKNRAEGFAKFIVDPETTRVLGAEIVGVGADLIINELAVIVQQSMTMKEVSEVIQAHPTLSEVVKESAFGILGYPINTL